MCSLFAHEQLDWIDVATDEFSGTKGVPATLSWMSSFLSGGGKMNAEPVYLIRCIPLLTSETMGPEHSSWTLGSSKGTNLEQG